MDRLLNVSDRTNAALHVLALAAQSNRSIKAADAAARLGASPSYVAKVLQLLVAGGILESMRGASGGFKLARDAAEITALEVLELLDGPLPERECLFKRSVCVAGTCAIKELTDKVAAETHRVLKSTTVASLAEAFAQEARPSAPE